MAELTIEEMEAILAEHEICELAQDIEATMGTKLANPLDHNTINLIAAQDFVRPALPRPT